MTVWNNQTVVFGLVQLEVVPGGDGKEPQTERKIYLVSITARILGAKEHRYGQSQFPPIIPIPPLLAAIQRHPSNSDLPYGSPVAGKPGFITSPYAPDAGMVDIRGFPPNTKVKDPYTGKEFLVP